jgi:Domain of unknown function (DUF4132)
MAFTALPGRVLDKETYRAAGAGPGAPDPGVSKPAGGGGGRPGSVFGVPDGDDAYGPRMRAEHRAVLAADGVAEYLAHCAGLDEARAGRKWRARTAESLARAPRAAEATRLLLEGFAGQPEGEVTVRWSYGAVTREPGLVCAANARLIRGLLWALADLGADSGQWAVPLAGQCAVYAGTGLRGSAGPPRSGTVAAAAVAVLASFEGARGEQAVRELTAVQGTVRDRSVLKGARRARHEIAARTGLTPAQLRERSVPTFGLDARRVREAALPGGHAAVLSVDAAGAASLAFRTPAGRVTGAAPREVGGTDELASQRAALEELRGLLSAERGRLEDGLTAGAEWTGADWRRCYADHPVTGAVAGAMVWETRAAAGAAHTAGAEAGWVAGLPARAGAGWVLAGHDGTAVPVGPGDRLRLWHPSRAEPDDVRAWRTAVMAGELRQPFKQVFREVYALGAAGEPTVGEPAAEMSAVAGMAAEAAAADPAAGSSDGRFAGHVLRFTRARAEMAARGWSADQLGYRGDGQDGEAVREVPAAGSYGWRARLSYRLVERDEDGYAVTLCSTGRVRFERRTGARGAWMPAGLAQVPALVFSEAMRDVDLFVGAASIATDPLWRDGGHARHQDYWRRAAFGRLPASAEVRKEALARLLPRTRIADRAELDGRFLRVRGELGTYRIHLGSGNVLLEPGGASLCITPATGPAAGSDTAFLPFEEDGGMLAVVLSTAFLLADDTSITDPSLTTQLPGRRRMFRPTA